MRTWQRLILIALMVATCVLMVLPTISCTTIDYGNPIEARWEDASKEAEANAEQATNRKTVIEFDESGSLNRLYDLIHAPVQPPLWLLIPLILVLGITYLFLTMRFTDDEDQFGLWMLATIGVQVVLLVACIISAVANNSYFDVTDRITASIQDQELAKKVIESAHQQQILIPLRAVLGFLMGDVVIFVSTLGIGALIEVSVKAFTRYKNSLLEDLEGGRGTLALRHDGTIERVQYDYKFRWLPFPAIVPKRTVVGHLSWSESCQLLVRAASNQSLETLCRQFKISLGDLFETVGAKTSQSIVSTIGNGVGDGMQSHLQQTVTRDEAATVKEAESLLQGISDKTLQRFQQELVAHAGEAVGGHLNDFRQQAIAFLQRRASGDATYVPHDGSTFPDGTKFCLSKGKATVFVVEEKPQVRTVTFREGFVRGKNDYLTKDTTFQLAFPYVIFVVKLWEGRFSCLCVYFAKRPLQSLTDTLCWPSLPNIHSDGSVCLRYQEANYKTAAECVRAVISHFWQSAFNNDLRDHYDHGDNPIRNVWDWEKQSQKDAAFVLTTNWRESGERLEHLIERLLRSDREDEVATAEQVVRKSLDKAMTSLTAVIQKACGEVTVEKRYAKLIAKELSAHLQALGTTVLRCMMTRLNSEVASTNGKARHQFDFHLQRAVNEAVTKTFVGLAAAALLEHSQLPDNLYYALEERRN